MQEEARQDEQCHTSLRHVPGLRFPQSGVAEGFHDSHPRRVSGFPISAESLKSADTTQRLVCMGQKIKVYSSHLFYWWDDILFSNQRLIDLNPPLFLYV